MTDLIYDVAWSLAGNKKIKCVIFGGSSMPPYYQLRNSYGAESLRKHSSAIGTGGVMVMDENTNLLKVLLKSLISIITKAAGNAQFAEAPVGWKKLYIN